MSDTSNMDIAIQQATTVSYPSPPTSSLISFSFMDHKTSLLLYHPSDILNRLFSLLCCTLYTSNAVEADREIILCIDTSVQRENSGKVIALRVIEEAD